MLVGETDGWNLKQWSSVHKGFENHGKQEGECFHYCEDQNFITKNKGCFFAKKHKKLMVTEEIPVHSYVCRYITERLYIL